MTRFHFFKAEKYLFVCLCLISFTHSFVGRQLDCLHLLAIMNSAAMNTGVQIFFQEPIIICFRNIPRSGIAGSYGNSKFNFFEELPYCFP